MKNSILLTLSIVFYSAHAQNYVLPDSNQNYFSFVTTNLSAVVVGDTLEGSKNVRLAKHASIWGERLYPHGDFNIANAALKQAVSSYPYSKISFDPNWIDIGINKHPVALSSAESTNGVGQIHRIAFNSGYDGITNKTVYAASSFGGLWRSTDKGNNWKNVNTDLGLPFCNVSDIAVHPTDSNVLFISTGISDGGFPNVWSNNSAAVNTLFTQGVYRSINYGDTWHLIDGTNEFQAFIQGGTIRKLMINPNNSNQLIAATSFGIMICNNAMSTNPTWAVKLNTTTSNKDQEFRGLEFKPNNTNTIYASGQDIYKSIDNGNNWTTMTGQGTGLEYNQLELNSVLDRINIATTIDNANVLYALLYGSHELSNGDRTGVYHIFKYNGSQWSNLYSSYNLGSSDWLSLEVSPVDENIVYFGNVQVFELDNNTVPPTERSIAAYSGNGHHADVHCLEIHQSNSNELWAGNHGGVSIKDFNTMTRFEWKYLHGA